MCEEPGFRTFHDYSIKNVESVKRDPAAPVFMTIDADKETSASNAGYALERILNEYKELKRTYEFLEEMYDREVDRFKTELEECRV